MQIIPVCAPLTETIPEAEPPIASKPPPILPVVAQSVTLEQPFWALTSEAIANCVPGAQQVILQNVNHDGPYRDPAAFTAALFAFLSRR